MSWLTLLKIFVLLRLGQTGALLLKGLVKRGPYQIHDVSTSIFCSQISNKPMSIFSTLSNHHVSGMSKSNSNNLKSFFFSSENKTCNLVATTASIILVYINLLHQRLRHPTLHAL